MAKKKEIEIENKDVYVELEPLESVELKRALLEITASNINMQIIAEKFKEKARQEIRERALAKRHIRETAESINELIQNLPKAKEIPLAIKKEITEKLAEKEPEKTKPKNAAFLRELEEIKRKIASLS